MSKLVVDKVVVDLFAGPGGFDTGLRMADYRGRIVGFELDRWACATARAAGHMRIQADVAAVPLDRVEPGKVFGLLVSPPCKDWSTTGSGKGESGTSGYLIREPLRWALALMPTWTVWECTPNQGVLARFLDDADTLRTVGYHVWVGVLNATDYGVPSSRKRAFLIARRGWLHEVRPPQPTHDRPVTMAEALGWLDTDAVLVSNYGTGGDASKRGRRTMDQPAFTMTGKCCRNRWEHPSGWSRNLTPSEAGILQSFPADYPWRGGSTAVQQQIGDAVPPRLAAAVLGPLVSMPRVSLTPLLIGGTFAV